MIMRDGLRPGYQLTERQQYKRGRSDLHFSPFPPFDHRGEHFEKWLNRIRRDGCELVVFTVDPTRGWRRTLCCVSQQQMGIS